MLRSGSGNGNYDNTAAESFFNARKNDSFASSGRR
jgi:hypothetical protein